MAWPWLGGRRWGGSWWGLVAAWGAFQELSRWVPGDHLQRGRLSGEKGVLALLTSPPRALLSQLLNHYTHGHCLPGGCW